MPVKAIIKTTANAKPLRKMRLIFFAKKTRLHFATRFFLAYIIIKSKAIFKKNSNASLSLAPAKIKKTLKTIALLFFTHPPFKNLNLNQRSIILNNFCNKHRLGGAKKKAELNVRKETMA